MAQSPEQMAETMIRNLPEKTGKSLPEWVKLCQGSGIAKHGGLVKHLKSEYGITHGFANLIAHKSLKTDAGSAAGGGDDLVKSQYSGPKEPLRPIYDRLLEIIGSLGDDVEIAPKRSYVSIRRNKQFAIIQPSTKTRVDVGINLKGTEPIGRLEASGSFNAMVSHRTRITDIGQVDSELANWLRKAYETS